MTNAKKPIRQRRQTPKVHVIGVALSEAALVRNDKRLEELVFDTARSALADAGVRREELDNVTLGASDELDGRPISSMLLASPAGSYLIDEIRVSDSGATALCLATARILSGDFDLGLVAGWCKPSKTSVAAVENLRAEPFYLRDLGFDGAVADAVFAQTLSAELGLDESEIAERTVASYTRAARNTRGLQQPIPSLSDVRDSQYVATPVRELHRAVPSDGAASLILASEQWLRRHPEVRSLAEIAGVGWASDSYRLDRERLVNQQAARTAWEQAMSMAGNERPVDAVELDCPTVFHEAALCSALPINDAALTPSGGAFAQNPIAASGLVNIVEAVLQVSGRAGAVQLDNAARVVAHGAHGFASQGQVMAVLDRPREEFSHA